MTESSLTHTPYPIIAVVSRVVTQVVDRVTGDRVQAPLMVAAACTEALKIYGIEARVMYGASAWIEVLEDQSAIWTGCWGENFYFWTATQFGEVVDLNVSVSHRQRANDQLDGPKPMYSPPMLWSAEVPRFYRYQPEGIAELELTDMQDKGQFERVLAGVREHCLADVAKMGEGELLESEFANEPMIAPGRRMLDDSKQSFKLYDRALSVFGVPDAPF